MRLIVIIYGDFIFGMLYKGNLIVLKKWSPFTPLADIEFTSTEIWVQIHGLAPITMH